MNFLSISYFGYAIREILMKKLKFVLLFIPLFGLTQNLLAAIYWVGDSPACTGSQVRSSLDLALLAAAQSIEADEIRLTSTVSFTVGSNNYSLTDWSPNNRGALTIAGGYSDCFSGQSGRTNIGNVPGNVFSVQSSTQSSSEITLQNLQIVDAGDRGLVADGGAEVSIENVGISDNDDGGVQVSNGAFLEIDALTTINNNGSLSVASGGGIQCIGNNSELSLRGTLTTNQASIGGGLYVGQGCFAVLEGGTVIQGYGSLSTFSANNGGGIYVDNGGEVFANGGASRVVLRNQGVSENGGGLYVKGTGRVTLLNTLIDNNDAVEQGSAIYAIDGGTSDSQIYMDRALNCPFIISCSEIQKHPFVFSVVYVKNSLVDIKRTIVEENTQILTNPQTFSRELFLALNGGIIRLDRVAMQKNESFRLMAAIGEIGQPSASILGSHLTVSDNRYQQAGVTGLTESLLAEAFNGVIEIENSIIADTTGILFSGAGVVNADCILVDDADSASGFPNGSFSTAEPIFNNVPGGDARQMPLSPGVDMCLQDSFNWTGNSDIEFQSTPVNENTNPQGNPGQSGGIYDAGFDEVYANIGDDEFLLTVDKLGSGDGQVVSMPMGIDCGMDCNEVVFNQTIVTLTAIAGSGSEFVNWIDCPNPAGAQCIITVVEPVTIGAIFQPDDLIYANDFELTIRVK